MYVNCLCVCVVCVSSRSHYAKRIDTDGLEGASTRRKSSKRPWTSSTPNGDSLVLLSEIVGGGGFRAVYKIEEEKER